MNLLLKLKSQREQKASKPSTLPEAETHIPSTSADSGRSMVEMLATLAVIAILCIAGIVGYRIAMNFYSANQIAGEINFIRNDLNLKMAKGLPRITLEGPYDNSSADASEEIPGTVITKGNTRLQFNEFPVTYGCGDGIEDAIDCRDEESYYVEVSNIPKDICGPYVRLASNMRGLLFVRVNDDETSLAQGCIEGNNKISLGFETEQVLTDFFEVSEGSCVSDYDCAGGRCNSNNECVQCLGDDDCGEDTPRCETNTGVCVECTGSGDCVTKYCDTNYTCQSCQSNENCSDDYKCKTDNGACVVCLDDTHCSGNTPVCDTEINDCKGCENDTQCGVNKCKVDTGACVPCVNDSHCSGTTPVCDTSTNICKGCENDTQCGDNKCNLDTGACVPCVNDSHCSGNTPVCDTTTNICKGCEDDTQCGDNKCNLDTGACVPCINDSHCSGNTPICDTSTNICKGCEDDTQCGDNKCNLDTGACVPCVNDSHCSENTPVCNTTTNQCTTCADLDNTRPIWTGSGCIACTGGQIWDDTAKACICPTALPNWNGTTCLAPCTGGQEWNATSKTCVCPTSKPNWNGTSCIACTSPTPYWNQTLGCVACTSDSHCTSSLPKCDDTGNCSLKYTDIGGVRYYLSNEQFLQMNRETKAYCPNGKGMLSCSQIIAIHEELYDAFGNIQVWSTDWDMPQINRVYHYYVSLSDGKKHGAEYYFQANLKCYALCVDM